MSQHHAHNLGPARSMVRRMLRGFTIAAALLGAGTGVAAEVWTPDALGPWTRWVQEAHPDLACAMNYERADARQCVWPTRLELRVSEQGAAFTYDVDVLSESVVPLPGDQSTWPQNVRTERGAVLVTARNGLPVALLAAGSYRISGDFQWPRAPEKITVADPPALIVLTRNDQPRPGVIEGNQLILGESQARTASEQDRLQLRVFRLLTDGIPATLETRIAINVSGQRREIELGRALLDGWQVSAFAASLPARLEANGNLRVLAEPGQHTIDVTARRVGEVTDLAMARATPNWPEQEVWAVDFVPALRRTQITGAPSIDPSQTDLPAEYAQRSDAVYLLGADASLRLTVEQRGDAAPAPDTFDVTRELWLDFDGSGLTARDQLRGVVHAPRLLVAQAGQQPGRVELDGAPQWISQTDDGRAAISLPGGQHVDIAAVSRLERSNIPLVGWDAEAQSLSMTLNVPPGWLLVAAPGADAAPQAWIERWTLWNLFIVLLVTAAIWQLLGRNIGLLALFTLVICEGTNDMLFTVWLTLTGLLALLKVIPQNAFRTFLQGSYGVLLVLWALVVLDFGVERARIALYPQLDSSRLETPYQASLELVRVAPAAPAEALEDDAGRVAEQKLMTTALPRRSQAADSASVNRYEQQRYGANANVQTGPGIPDWRWQQASVGFSGPVHADQHMSFVLLSPPLFRVMNLLMAVSALALLATFVLQLLPGGQRPSLGGWWPGPSGRSSPDVDAPLAPTAGATAAGLALLIPALLGIVMTFASPAANAADAFPPDSLLKDLEKRLLAPAPCLPQCASLAYAVVSDAGGRLSIALELHALEQVAVPLPSNPQWRVTQITLDNAAATLRRGSGGQLLIRLPKGRHLVVMNLADEGLRSVRIPFPLPPGRLQLQLSTWNAIGMVDERLRGDTLELERGAQQQSASDAVYGPPAITPLVYVWRHIGFGIDWEVTTTVVRVAPMQGAINVAVPLLTGERVLDANVPVSEGQARVSLPASASAISWRSGLPVTERIDLTASSDGNRIEIWSVAASSLWHVRDEGLAPVQLQDVPQLVPHIAANRVWATWPGDQLALVVHRPEPLPGETQTLESAQVSQNLGIRQSEQTLTLTVLASQAGTLDLPLPAGAQLLSLQRDGVSLPLPLAEQATVQLPIAVDRHTYQVQWREMNAMSFITRTPSLTLPLATTNLTLNTRLPEGRWLLLVGGPTLGPAMLFWGLLFVVLAAAFALGYVRVLPLTRLDWLLLGVGMSTVYAFGMIVVVLWFFAFHARNLAANANTSVPAFDTLQVVLGLLTLVFISVLLNAVQAGLLDFPDMRVIGNESDASNLNWFQDRVVEGELPQGWMVSLPMWTYRLAMLAWSVWLAFALLRWLRWGWDAFSNGGLWRRTTPVLPGGEVVTEAVPANDSKQPWGRS